jgi:hypothetical protein
LVGNGVQRPSVSAPIRTDPDGRQQHHFHASPDEMASSRSVELVALAAVVAAAAATTLGGRCVQTLAIAVEAGGELM